MGVPKVVGIKSGCFTVLTAGHVYALTEARKKCDRLIVIVNNDEYVYRKKGVAPIPQDERVAIVGALECVDEAIGYNEDNEHQWLWRYKQEIMPKYGPDAKLVVFHDRIMLGRDPKEIPGFGIANSVVILSRNDDLTSVSDVFSEIGKLNGI